MNRHIKDKLDLNWQWFRDFFSFPIIRFMVYWFSLVPVAVSMFSILPGTLCTGTSPDICVSTELPFTWWILWISSVSFILSYSLYHIYCPNFIKKYQSYSQYLEHGHAPRWLAWEIYNVVSSGYEVEKLVDRLTTKGYMAAFHGKLPSENPSVQNNYTEVFVSVGKRNYSLKMPQAKQNMTLDEIEKDIFWEVFGRFAKSHKIIRISALALLFISLALVVIVVVQNIFSIIGYFW